MTSAIGDSAAGQFAKQASCRKTKGKGAYTFRVQAFCEQEHGQEHKNHTPAKRVESTGKYGKKEIALAQQ